MKSDYRPLVLGVLIVLLISRTWSSGTNAPGQIDKATYVYEKDDNSVPRPVQAALKELNERGIEATAIDDDVRTGTGGVPAQYKIALLEATNLPSLVIQAGDRVVMVVDDPRTESDVMDAVQ